MVIVRIIGGLGNQMFQYAFYRYLQKQGLYVKADITDFKSYKLHNGFELNKVFGINLNLAEQEEINKLKTNTNTLFGKIWYKLNGIKDTHLKEGSFNVEKVKRYENVYLDGYWQKLVYVKNIEYILMNDFKFKKVKEINNSRLANLINNTESVAIHVRRGDYVQNKKTFNRHGVCGLDYYRNAIDYIKQKIQNPFFFVFSDDTKWIKENFNFEIRKKIVEKTKSSCDYFEMYLMSLCKHNIIANSTFSWWSAWLNKNEKKIIISPKFWYRDSYYNKKLNELVPQKWIKI